MRVALSTTLLTTALIAAIACGDDETSDATTSSSTTGSGGTGEGGTTLITGTGVGASGGASEGGGGNGEGGFVELIPWEGNPPALTIAAECVNAYGVVVPNPGNEGHLAAARLTPPSYPFEVTEVVYELSNGPLEEGGAVCDAALAHRVEVYVQSAVVPSNTPTLAAQIDVPAGTPNDEPSRLVATALQTPIVLADGEHLFVAVKMAGGAEGTICVWMCEPTGSDDRNYWSNATMQPYDWAELASFNNPNDLRIGANGAPQ